MSESYKPEYPYEDSKDQDSPKKSFIISKVFIISFVVFLVVIIMKSGLHAFLLHKNNEKIQNFSLRTNTFSNGFEEKMFSSKTPSVVNLEISQKKKTNKSGELELIIPGVTY